MLPMFSPKSSTDRTLEGFSGADASWATEGIEGMVSGGGERREEMETGGDGRGRAEIQNGCFMCKH